jgi:hypothetical protein
VTEQTMISEVTDNLSLRQTGNSFAIPLFGKWTMSLVSMRALCLKNVTLAS